MSTRRAPSPSPAAGTDATAEGSTRAVSRLSKDDEERLVDSLFRQAIEKKQKSVASIEASVYKYAEPSTISKQDAEASAKRQCTEELERRKKKHEALVLKHEGTTTGKTLHNDDLQSSLQRVYDDAMRLKKERIEALRQKQEAADRALCGHRVLSKSEQIAAGERLSKPVKREYSLEEYNAVCVYARPQ